ncbi:cytochrome P450 family protein [Mycobacterium xenopi 4042]|uniref:Cytochrome P450 family protein n=1 Tax=Mycobacterium xenopi 4042 TaxID=1299334 RepID=X8AFF4_MYCXE|nr:cytochrome P450 family protein [Mycobacterium xenopi 4042]
MRRTVTTDGVALASGSHTFQKGDKVVMWYPAANRDPAVFRDPEVFDIARSPNNHVAFGGPGPHFCLGAHLARLELNVAFKMLYDRYPDITSVGEPVMLRSNFVNGIKHLRPRIHHDARGERVIRDRQQRYDHHAEPARSRQRAATG